jgi:protein arginine N-methyltransferase 5
MKHQLIHSQLKLQEAVSSSYQKKFSALITSLVSENYVREMIDTEAGVKQQCFSRSPLSLTATQWNQNVVPFVKITSDLNNRNPEVRENYEKRLLQEFEFYDHLKNHGTIYIKPSCKPKALGKFLKKAIGKINIHKGSSAFTFAIEININSKKSTSNFYFNDMSDEEKEKNVDNPWLYWHQLHKASDYSQHIEIALVLTSDLPSNEAEIFRWIGEPIGFLLIEHSIFVSNRQNYPVFAKKLQDITKLLWQYTRAILVIEPFHFDDIRTEAYTDYIKYILNSIKYEIHDGEIDILRYPLQPLYDNLDTGTYETFEKDPAKYILYQRAIEAALIDKVPQSELDTKVIVVMVVGAGRGNFLIIINNCKLRIHF